MRRWTRTSLVVIALTAAGMLAAVLPAAAADNVVHYTLAFYEESSSPIDDAGGCIGYSSGTILERRSFEGQVTEFVAGPQQGTIHLVGVVDATFTITPDPSIAGPIYDGYYREKITLKGSSLDTPDVASFILPATATGSDGSTLKFLLHGHVVMGANGDVKLEFQKFTCIQSGA